jgi:hypothetical protein
MTEHKIKAVGSKAEVFHGTAKHTSGGLFKKDLMRHKDRIISRKKHAAGKKAIKFLFDAGFKPTKGKFVVMRKSMAKKTAKVAKKSAKRSTRRTRRTRRRGGNAEAAKAASPMNSIMGMMKTLGAK